MKAGKLDRRIVIERATETRDGFNVPIKAWDELACVAASKEDVRDSERVASQEIGAEITTRFQIRYSSDVADVDPRDRIRFEGRVYDIVARKEIGRRDGIELSAVARAENT